MGRKAKYSYETKLEIAPKCLSGKSSMYYKAKKHDIGYETLRRWIANYQSLGTEGLKTTRTNTKYSPELNAVLDYLNGQAFQQEICKKYGIRPTCSCMIEF